MKKTQQKPFVQAAFLATLLPTAEPWAGNRLAPDAPYLSDLVELIQMAAVIPAWQPLAQQLRAGPRAWPERTAAEAETALTAMAAAATVAVPALPCIYQLTAPLNSVTLELANGATYLADPARLVRILACTAADRVMAGPGASGPSFSSAARSQWRRSRRSTKTASANLPTHTEKTPHAPTF